MGSVVALTTMIAASMLNDGAWPPSVVLPVVLAVGTLFGFTMGCIIHYFDIRPCIVTLAGLFLARGLCTTISTASISITDPFWTALAQEKIRFGKKLSSHRA